jgi:hypothetical protein
VFELKKLLTLGFAISAVFIAQIGMLSAQETATIINSNPPGAAITLDGEYKLTATTPCRLPETIVGKFTLRAVMPGYESWSGNIMIIPGQENHFSFGLSPKTRLKAALRSIFVPGWGQYYAGERKKGYTINVVTLGFGLGTLLADHDFRQKRDDYTQAQLDLENATSYADVQRLRQLVIDKNREAYDAETLRNTFVYATAIMWTYNVLDAIIFFPDRKLYFHQESVPIKEAQIDPDIGPDKIGLKLTASF